MKKRILTGDRPTGKLHLGHFVGTLKNRIEMQDEYDMYLLVADIHTLTTATSPEKTDLLKDNIENLVIDQIASGIDPEKVTFWLQSLVPEDQVLAIILGNFISVTRLQRVPTLKEVMRDLQIENASFGLLGYPVLMSSDILIVKGEVVPVGKDQASHLEVTREIARTFNNTYGQVFPEPMALIPKGIGTLPGLDGKAKMSKSLGNAIFLSDSSGEVKKKVMRMYTDPTRIRVTDPGHIEGNAVFTYHDVFNPNKDEVADMKQAYEHGKISDVAVKEKLYKVLEDFLSPIREKRAKLEKDKGRIKEIIIEGSKKARTESQKTLEEVKEKIGLSIV